MGRRAVRVPSPDRSERTTILIVVRCALNTQFWNLCPNLAQLIKGMVQLGVEHGDQVDCDILSPGMGYPGPRLNRINRVTISTRCIFFLEAYLERTSKLSVLGLKQFGMSDRLRSFLGCT
jgi:hypothetical protein